MQRIYPATEVPAGIEIDTAKLQRGTTARESWRLNDLTSYVYEIDQHCFCNIPGSARVYVENGRVSLVENLENGEFIDSPETLLQFKTIPQLFEQIDRVLRNQPDAVFLEHNRYLGFPTSFRANPRYLVGDDEIDYRIHWLKRLHPK